MKQNLGNLSLFFICILSISPIFAEQTPESQTTLLQQQADSEIISVIPYEFNRDGLDILYLVNDTFDQLFVLSKKDPLNYYGTFKNFIKELEDSKKYNVYKDRIEVKDLHIKVLRDKPKNCVIGFIMYFFNANKSSGEIWLMAVKEAYRGKGYGKQLLQYAIDDMCTTGAQNIYIRVRVTNNVAQGLYKNCGFLFLETECGCNPDNSTILMLRKTDAC